MRSDFMGMLEDILLKAKDVTNAATKKTDELVKVSKLKLTCVQINNDIKAAYEHLGSLVYHSMKADEENPSAIIKAVTEVDDLYDKLDEATAKLEELQKILTCPKCGTKNKLDSIYCSKCGTRLVVVEAQDEGTSFDAQVKEDENPEDTVE